jgi:hypothetical protein
MLGKLPEIKIPNPIYNIVIKKFSGLVFHRVDDLGDCWVKPVTKQIETELRKFEIKE